jgi:hypothetical protein
VDVSSPVEESPVDVSTPVDESTVVLVEVEPASESVSVVFGAVVPLVGVPAEVGLPDMVPVLGASVLWVVPLLLEELSVFVALVSLFWAQAGSRDAAARRVVKECRMMLGAKMPEANGEVNQKELG